MSVDSDKLDMALRTIDLETAKRVIREQNQRIDYLEKLVDYEQGGCPAPSDEHPGAPKLGESCTPAPDCPSAGEDTGSGG